MHNINLIMMSERMCKQTFIYLLFRFLLIFLLLVNTDTEPQKIYSVFFSNQT